MGDFENRIKNHPFGKDNTNENEKRVVKKLVGIHRDYPDQCWCNACLNNIYCLALNALPAKYENAIAHHLFKSNRLPDGDVEQAVRNAIEKVAANPKGGSHQ